MFSKLNISKGFTIALCSWITACTSATNTWDNLTGPGYQASEWNISHQSHTDLISLPSPKGKIPVSVYSFRDMSGQYKSIPSSSFSTAVTQGSGAILVKALRDSGWFLPLEREGLQSLLTERKIIRATKAGKDLTPLMQANILLEGGVIGYDSNIKTGGAGAKYFGIGASEQYRVDKVTINLRAVDVRSGLVINSVTVSKSVLSREVVGGVFRFIKFKRLLELEAGYTDNEPVQLCVQDAIETAVIRLVVEGIRLKSWELANAADMASSVITQFSRGI